MLVLLQICWLNIGKAIIFLTFSILQEQITRLAETETSPFVQFTVWIWDGSRYSGMLCMALSSIIYCIMEVLSDVFTGK